MPDTHSPDTLDTSNSEFRLNRFEARWLAWRVGEPAPHWREDLPKDEDPCNPDLIFFLLQLDIECRVKAGLPALLAEPYFAHPRLQREDARLDAERQVELIRWEYQQRWQQRDAARRAEYEAAFPEHAAALRDLKPLYSCPRCRNTIVLEETAETLRCSNCGHESLLTGVSPSFVTPLDVPALTTFDLDPRDYELIESLGKGGMGEVYRCCDPALGRDLAIKVMKAELHGYPEYERRFLREARITSSLQHPGIVPVHNLGRLADDRLHYTMRLVGGDTFADILRAEAGKTERLPYLLSIFEKVCQAVAYAHSKRVIHRDLKPSNVMVGKFGEVQVMDWGLAKLLTPEAAAESEETTSATGPRIPTDADTPVDLSRMDFGFGTLPYMPSEQAKGKWDTVDERADVFALGSILCEILTGQPAYIGTNNKALRARVERGDVTEALQRLQQCGADPALTALCRECLSLHREGRPRDAGIVAKCVADHQAEMQERLRQAELERVAAQTRAREEQARAVVEQERTREALGRIKAERRAARRMLALAVAMMALLAGGGGGLWWKHIKQEQTEREVLVVLEGARERLGAGWQQQDLTRLTEVNAEGERASAIARHGGASEALAERVAAFQTEVRDRLDRTEKNKRLLLELLDIVTPHETKTYESAGPGQRKLLAQPSVDEQYTAAFRRWGLDIEQQAESDVVSRVQKEPEIVLQGVIAALDGWILKRRRNGQEADSRNLLGIVEALDNSEPRRQLRALMISAAPPSVESVVGILTAWPPWAALWQQARGNVWRGLRELRERMDVSNAPVPTVLLLGAMSVDVGDLTGAESVFRQALARRPGQIALLYALGDVLERQGASHLPEATGCFRAARAKQPKLGIALVEALERFGKAAEGEAVSHDLHRLRPEDPEIIMVLGNSLYRQRKYKQAEEEYRKAIALLPDFGKAYLNLGNALDDQGRPEEAQLAFRKALELKADPDIAYYNWSFANINCLRF